MAEHLADQDVLNRIRSLVQEEHRLLRQATISDGDRVRLEQTKVSLDQYWDLLRQRRALREFDGDPDRATMRSASVVEQYEQ